MYFNVYYIGYERTERLKCCCHSVEENTARKCSVTDRILRRSKENIVLLLLSRRWVSAVLAMALCLSVCLSRHMPILYRIGWKIELCFGTEDALGLSYTPLKGNSIRIQYIQKYK